MKDWLTQVLEWLERIVPTVIASFGLGLKVGETGKNKIRAELDKTKTELELKNNELQNEKDFYDKSDDDIVSRILKGSGPNKPDSEG